MKVEAMESPKEVSGGWLFVLYGGKCMICALAISVIPVKLYRVT